MTFLKKFTYYLEVRISWQIQKKCGKWAASNVCVCYHFRNGCQRFTVATFFVCVCYHFLKCLCLPTFLFVFAKIFIFFVQLGSHSLTTVLSSSNAEPPQPQKTNATESKIGSRKPMQRRAKLEVNLHRHGHLSTCCNHQQSTRYYRIG